MLIRVSGVSNAAIKSMAIGSWSSSLVFGRHSAVSEG